MLLSDFASPSEQVISVIYAIFVTYTMLPLDLLTAVIISALMTVAHSIIAGLKASNPVYISQVNWFLLVIYKFYLISCTRVRFVYNFFHRRYECIVKSLDFRYFKPIHINLFFSLELMFSPSCALIYLESIIKFYLILLNAKPSW